jgi:hypothetical protein
MLRFIAVAQLMLHCSAPELIVRPLTKGYFGI